MPSLNISGTTLSDEPLVATAMLNDPGFAMKEEVFISDASIFFLSARSSS
jgi:hypothetical protein